MRGGRKVASIAGSAFVPLVRALFVRKFVAERLVGGDEFSSFAQGLALMGSVRTQRGHDIMST